MISSITAYSALRFINPVTVKDDFIHIKKDNEVYIFVMTLLTIFVMVSLFVKMLNYLRAFQKYGQLVQLIYGVRKEVQPFMILFMGVCYMFSLIYIIVGANYSPHKHAS